MGFRRGKPGEEPNFINRSTPNFNGLADICELMRKQLDFLALILYCGFIYWLSDQSRLPTPDLFENEDKLQHLLAYFVMGVFAWRAFRRLPLRREAVILACIGFCSLYGLSDEWHQSFVIGRNSSALDWLADSLGGLLAAIACTWQARKSGRQQSPAAID